MIPQYDFIFLDIMTSQSQNSFMRDICLQRTSISSEPFDHCLLPVQTDGQKLGIKSQIFPDFSKEIRDQELVNGSREFIST